MKIVFKIKSIFKQNFLIFLKKSLLNYNFCFLKIRKDRSIFKEINQSYQRGNKTKVYIAITREGTFAIAMRSVT